MNNDLIKAINDHVNSAIRDAFFTGSQYGLGLGKRILNGEALTQDQEKVTMAEIEKLYEKFRLKPEYKELNDKLKGK